VPHQQTLVSRKRRHLRLLQEETVSLLFIFTSIYILLFILALQLDGHVRSPWNRTQVSATVCFHEDTYQLLRPKNASHPSCLLAFSPLNAIS
jgi:hypothetical protein